MWYELLTKISIQKIPDVLKIVGAGLGIPDSCSRWHWCQWWAVEGGDSLADWNKGKGNDIGQGWGVGAQ